MTAWCSVCRYTSATSLLRYAFSSTFKGNVSLMGQCDRDLRRRIRKVPGVPLMYVVKHKYQIERLPE